MNEKGSRAVVTRSDCYVLYELWSEDSSIASGNSGTAKGGSFARCNSNAVDFSFFASCNHGITKNNISPSEGLLMEIDNSHAGIRHQD
jgi:hypothetical protein